MNDEVGGIIGYRVMPTNKVLGCTGYMWEYFLYIRGWNSLPNEEQYGIIKDCFELPNKEVVFDVYWPGVDCLTKNIFPGEIRKYTALRHNISERNKK